MRAGAAHMGRGRGRGEGGCHDTAPFTEYMFATKSVHMQREIYMYNHLMLTPHVVECHQHISLAKLWENKETENLTFISMVPFDRSVEEKRICLFATC